MEQIGLKAVMDMVGFTAGMKAYNEKIKEAGDNTDKESGKISKAFSAISKVAAGIAVGGVAMLTTAAIGGIKAFTDWGATIDDVGDVLGTTSEESSALAVAAESVGGNVEQLTGQIAFMARGLVNAKGELGPTGTALQQLGVDFKDANGNMLPTTDIFQAVSDKLAAMPDGLEKSALMMDIFGKSGKEMGDLMNITANGGLAAMDEKAKKLGLSMSGPATEGAIKMNLAMNDLKLMGKGLLVTLGSELLPILQPLIEQFMKAALEALPSVKKAIQDAIPVIQDIVKWIGDNLIPIIQSLIKWMIIYLPPAIKTAIEWFNEHLLPILKDLWAFIQDPLLPTLGKIVAWLGTIIKAAIETFVNDIWPRLKTAFETVKNFIEDPLLPTFRTIGTWLGTTIGNIIETFKGVWGGLKTAFKTVSDFIYDKLTGPDGMLTTIIVFFRDKIAGPINSFVNGALAGLNQAFGTLKDILGPIIDLLKWIIENVGKALGIGQGFAAKVGAWAQEIYDENNNTGGKGRPKRKIPQDTFGGFDTGGGSMMVTNSNTVNIYVSASINNGMDLAAFDAHLLDVVKGAL